MTPALARAYVVAAWLSRLAVVAAVAFALWAAIRFGPLAGLVSAWLGTWLARFARPPLPPDYKL